MRSWRTRRRRLAPIARRRLARFVHAIRSTSATVAISTAAKLMNAPRSCGMMKPGGMSLILFPSSVSGYSLPTCSARRLSAASARSRLTPSLSRPTAKMFCVPRLSSQEFPGSIHSCIVIGSQTSGV